MKFQALVVAAVAVSVSARQAAAIIGDPIADFKADAISTGCYEDGANTVECIEKLAIDDINDIYGDLKPLLMLTLPLPTVTAAVEDCYGEADCAATAACNAGYNSEGLALELQTNLVDPVAACCGTDDVQTCTEAAIDAGIAPAQEAIAGAGR
ncbi:hypothetical protein SARC_07560 [Sphaeroforma arctica JP610]|uniref:Saposin B-type domain-containing protein n=1 Tax=Sphaeroforma arctica JP610 TaxID=667725 RepID=A0A0L0FTG3_9EUKA|nr:hypothetical protein SARC_07560 [Sphaeroforma arctica JP610]KNC80072.1 hypothetical protein SARC_07560 [Sphaeroforma arctica JP610]|eukprot:XP_014153974.1 hypothetical protein SARC_07560 [Sphaeroforma arctica JP610]